MRRYSKYFIACFLLLIPAFLLLLNAQYSGLAVNRWTPAAEMATARAAACTALLPDGRVLVAGGNNGSSAVGSVELYGANGAFTVAASMHAARAGAACATLQDGRVFVAGGNDGTSALRSAEIYNPALDSWTSVGDMNAARSGHMAVLLPWGAVLLAGGDGQGLVEAYNVVHGDFQVMGSLSSARKDFAVAALANHRVAIAGGSDGSSALASIDILDFDARTITPAGAMKTARTNFAAAATLDGKVLLTGGLDAAGRVLATSEIFDPVTGESAAGPNLSSPRANHQAYALPGNGGILLVGGTNGDASLATTDRYSPRSGAFSTAAAMKSARSAQSLSLLRTGALMVAGGRNSNGALTSTELYGFATLAADKPEYFPGETASFSGTGWKPGETVLLQVSALPVDAHKIEFTAAATADSNGRVQLSGFHVDQSHMGMKFQLSATGVDSQADSAFADADSTAIQNLSATPPTGAAYPTTVLVSGQVANVSSPGNWPNDTVAVGGRQVAFWIDSAPITYLTNITGGAGGFTASFDPTTALIPPGSHTLTFTWPYAVPNASCGADTCNLSSASITYAVNNVDTTTTVAPGSTVNYGTAASLSASVQASGYGGYPSNSGAGSVSFQSGSTVVSCTSWVDGAVGSGQSTCYAATPTNLPAGTYNFTAYYNSGSPNSGFNNSSSASTENITVNKVAPTVTFTPLSASYLVGSVIPFTVTVASGAGTPTGTVIIYGGTSGNTVMSGPLTLSGGAVSTSVTFLEAGINHVRASYSGDASFAAADSTTGNFSITGASTTTAYTSGGGATSEPFGTAHTFTAAVTISGTSLPTGPTGTVTFIDMSLGVTLGTAGITKVDTTHGTASLTVNDDAACPATPACILPPSSPHNIRAQYNPSTGNGLSVSDTSGGGDAAYTVTRISPNFGVIVNPEPSLVHGDITITVTSPAVRGVTPTGNATLVVNGASIGSWQAINNGVVVFNYTMAAAGTVPIGAVYGGDSVFTPQAGTLGAGGNAVNHTTNPGVTTTVVTSIPNTPVSYGAPVTYRATVSSPNGTDLTGAVHFYDGGADVAGCTAITLQPAGTADCTPAAPGPVPGDHPITATYTPTGTSYVGSTSAFAYVLHVNKATAGESFTAFSPATITYGTATNAHLVLTPVTGVGSAGGRVSGTMGLYEGSTLLATSASFGGVDGVQDIVVALPDAVIKAAGTHTLTLRYSGDANYNPSVPNYAQQTITVNKAPTTTTPTWPVSAVNYGATVSLPVTVTSTAGTPTGTVTATFGTTTLATGTLASGAVTLTFVATQLAQGNNTVVVTYAGDANFATSNASEATFAITTADTTAVVTSSPNPSTQGQSVNFTVTVTANTSGTPTSLVALYDGATPIGLPATLSGGVATIAISSLTTGSHPALRAHYLGDANYNSSISAAFTQTVSKGAVMAAVTSSLNPSANGQAVTFTATITPVAPATIKPGSGVVTFFVNGAAQATTTTLPAPSGTGAATATLSWTPSANGNYAITASYTGTADPNYGDATSPQLTQSVGGSPTTTVISTTTASPTTWSQAVVLNAVVTVNPPATGTPTGNVQFLDNGTVIGTGALSGTAPFTATITTTTLAVGTHTLTAQYMADAQFAASSSGTPVTFTVNKAATTTTPTWPATTVAYGATVSLPVTVSTAATGTPTGTVTATFGATTLATGTLSGGSATLTFVANLPIGANTLVVTYSGDTNFATSSNTDAAFNVGKAGTTTVLTSSPNPSGVGQSVTFMATVTSATSGTPTGTVTFMDGLTALGTGTLSGGVATFSISTLAQSATPHSITAVYGSDANYSGSTSAALGQTVGKGAVTVAVGSSLNPSANGQPVTFTATVTPVAPAINRPGSGSVQFYVNGAATGSAVVLAASSGTGAATATLSWTPSANGNYAITATYDGTLDPSYGSAASAQYTQSVGGSPTTTVISTTTTSPTTWSQPVVLKAVVTVNPPATGTPTGNVQFLDNGTVLGASAVSGSPLTATFTTTALTVGTHTLTAQYLGDTQFQASTSGTPLAFTVNKAATTTTPTWPISTVAYGATVTLPVTVSTAATGTPTGTVTATFGATTLATGTLSSGSATLTFVANLPISATNSVVVTYSGDANFATSNATDAAFNVGKANTTTALTSSANPSAVGQSVTFTATVTSATSGTPTGTVTFMDGLTALGTGTLSGGVATFSISTLAQSTTPHSITAVYGSDANYNASTSSVLGQTVGKGAVTVAVGSSLNPSANGQAVTFTATIAPVAPAINKPGSGSVQFFVNGTATGSAIVLAASSGTGAATATLSWTPSANGNYAITATYDGTLDPSYGSGASAQYTQSVGGSATTTVISTTTTSPTTWSQAVVLNAVVSVNPPATGTPTGNVQFLDNGTVIGVSGLSATAPFTATFTTTALAVGTHTLTAQYLADAQFAASISGTPVTFTVNKAATTTTPTWPISTVAYGATVTLPVTVSTAATGTPTGTVTATFGATTLATGTLSGGSAILTFVANLPISTTNTLVVTYSGDASFATSNNTDAAFNVGKANTAAALTSAPNPSALGQNVTFTATVTSATSGTPTGTVTFYDGLTALGTGTLSGGVATFTISTLAPVTSPHSFTAQYGGDGNFNTSTSGAVLQTVNKGAVTVAVVSDRSPSSIGQAVTLTATIMPVSPAIVKPGSGSVQFYVNGTATGAAVVLPASAGTGATTATLVWTPAANGNYSITASYDGSSDPNYGSAASLAFTQAVGGAGTSTAISASTVSPSVWGQPVTLSATVTVNAPATGTPTGSVQFIDGAGTVIGSQALPASGPFTVGITTTALTVGDHSLTAKYLGDAQFASSISSTPVLFTVGKAATALTTVANTAGTGVFGTPMTFSTTLSITSPGAGTPTGTITFMDGPNVVGTAAVNAGAGTYSVTTSALSRAGHSITAIYSGDANFQTFTTGTALSQTITRATLGGVIASPTVSALPIGANVVYGQTVTFRVTLTGVTGTPAIGTIEFDAGGVALCSAAAITTNAFGTTATCTAQAVGPLLGVGTPSITVSNLGAADPNYSLGTIAPFSFVVAKANTAVALTATPAAVGPNQTVTFTAAVSVVTPGVAPVAGNTVTFTSNGSAIACTNAAPGIIAGGVAACTTTFATAGVYNIVAAYNGDANTAVSQGALVFNVNKPVPVLTIGSSLNPSHYGDTVVFTGVATAPTYPGPPVTSGPVPQGSLQFNDGAAILGTVALSPISGQPASQAQIQVGGCAPGALNCVPTVLTGGNHAITVLYIPGVDPNYGAVLSSSQTSPVGVLNQVVDQAASAVSNIIVTANPAVPVYGQPVTLTVTVTPFSAANTGKPTGTVTFDDAGNVLGAVAVNPATGVATITITTLSVGLHANLHATYSGDANFSGSSASPGSTTVAFAPTEVFLGALPASPTYGQSVTLSARVCALAFGQLASGSVTDCRSVSAPLALPGSTITFYDGTTAIGTSAGVDVMGNGSITITLFHQGAGAINTPEVGGSPHVITAVYNGGAGYDPSYATGRTFAGSNLVIGLAPTQTTVTTNVNAPVTGQVFTLHAVVSSATSFGPPPTGSVDFYDTSGSGFVIGTGVLVANGAYSYADLQIPTAGGVSLAVGTHVITARYDGSGTYATSSSPTSGATAMVLMVSKASTTTVLGLCSIQTTGACTTDTPVIGQTVKLTATVTVTAPGVGAPTGTVQFFNGTALLGTAAVIGVSGGGSSTVYQASYQVTLPMGALNLTAVYSGDVGFATSTSPVVTQSVTKPNVNTNITSSLNPAILGTPVTFTVVITPVPPATGVPTGTVTFYDGVSPISSAIALVGGAATYTPPTSAMYVATHPIGVTYNGDANFQGWNSGPLVYETINKVPASLYLTSNSFTAIASQVITLTAQVAGPASIATYPAATGQVSFYDGTTLIGVGTLTGGFATLNLNNLAAGTHNLSAIYNGDGNWTNATSVYVPQTITKATTVTQIASSVNPAVFGQQVVFTVNVAVPAPGTLPATGQVQLYDNNNALGDPQLANNGTFTIPVQSFTAGTHNIYAKYLGDANFASSQSATLSLVVNKAPTTSVVAAMPYSSTSGQSVTLTAVVNVTAPGSGVPTGSVQFVNTTTATVLGTAPLTVIGGVYTASITTTALNQAGAPQLLTATYSGDANFATSTSPAQAQSVFGNEVAVTNAAGYMTTHFAPDSIANLWGDHLSTITLSATTIPLPTGLGGTTVTVLDSAGVSRLAPLFYVSPGQVNFVVPSNTAFGLATITVTTSGGVSASTMVLITYTSPGIFSANGTGQGVAAAQLVTTHANGSQDLLPAVATYNSTQKAWVANPISLGTATDTATLVLYGTGVRYRPGPLSVTATINGTTLPVQYSGAQPTWVGLDQMNINLPRTLVGAGVVNLYVTVNGELSNTVTLTIQ